MPISARLDAPSVLHHIIIRGIERRNIFRDNKDRDNFIDRLSDFGKKVSESRKGYLSYVKRGEEIYSKGRRKVQVEASDLLCYWAVRELGISYTDLAKQLEMTQPGVGYAVSRGEKIAKKHNYQLLYQLLTYLWTSRISAQMESMQMAGVTYKDIFFISHLHQTESLHFHELVHVIQWERLGVDDFLLAYGAGLMQFGYRDSPLEKMAYSLQYGFDRGVLPENTIELVQQGTDAIWNGMAPMLSKA